MPEIMMYWDGEDDFEPHTGFEVGDWNLHFDVPQDACGFRLGLPGHAWSDHWYFGASGNSGKTVVINDIACSSTSTGPSPDAIEVRGPVHGCSSGSFEFITPLASLGITSNQLITGGAGSFTADFTDPKQITWLNFAGAEIEPPEPPEPPELPEDWFEKEPDLDNCTIDSGGVQRCVEPLEAAALPGYPVPSPRIAMLMARNGGILPRVRLIAEPMAARVDVPSGRFEITCPAKLIMIVTFFRSADVAPATVRYRFRFAQGPISTVFSKRLEQAGPTKVHHSVPIPLPKPRRSTGGGGVETGSEEFGILVRPVEPIGGGGAPGIRNPVFEIEPLPENEHKGSVRVEVTNSAAGIVASGWQSYHIVCLPEPGRPHPHPELPDGGLTPG
jgi:hypothetical protein